jgi:hypothetical protein
MGQRRVSDFEVAYDDGGSQSGFFTIPDSKDGTISGSLANGNALDVVFRTGGSSTITLADAALVPLPAALPLLGVALLGLLAAARRNPKA